LKPILGVVLINLLVVAVLCVQVTPAPLKPLAGAVSPSAKAAPETSAQLEVKVPEVLVK